MEYFIRIYELKSHPIKISERLKLIKYRIDKEKIVKNKISSDEDSEISDEGDLNEIHSIETETECNTIIKLIYEIIEFSYKERLLVVYLPSSFWINLIKEYNIPDLENIKNCYNLRELYKKYNYLIKELFKEKEYTDIKRYYERDEFAFILNKNIKQFLEMYKNKLSDSEILGIILRFNPYYSIKDKDDIYKYKNNRETYFFDYINFNRVTESFIQNFHCCNFETIFIKNIEDYINKITNKITNIQTFGNIIKLIDINRIEEEKRKYYFSKLEEKYKLIIKNEINLIKNDNELDKAIKIIAEFVSKIFISEKNNRFLKEQIEQLDDKIKLLIYIELITAYGHKKYNDQKNCIYEIYLDKIKTKEGRENIIKLVQKLNQDEKNYFICEKLLEKCNFTKEEFFSNNENYKIQTLCLLNKELNIFQKLDKENKYTKNLVDTLDNIKHDLDERIIAKKDLEKFLNIKRNKYIEKNLLEIKEEDESDKYAKDKLLLITKII